jgi:hypothetical protein
MKTIDFNDPVIGFILKTLGSIIGIVFLFVARRVVISLDSIVNRLTSIETKMEVMTARYDNMQRQITDNANEIKDLKKYVYET